MVRDLSLLSLAEISAYLQLAVLRIDGIIIGTGILIIGCCWAILFFWLNICVRREIPPQIDKGIEEARVGSERSEEVVEQPSAPPLILPSQKVGETENISTITSRVSG
uniref:Transmembrane protein n=1 Tax=Meloidogyne hapla TaxID=6305 RepID=A0A1I8BTB8_MELHA